MSSGGGLSLQTVIDVAGMLVVGLKSKAVTKTKGARIEHFCFPDNCMFWCSKMHFFEVLDVFPATFPLLT